VVAFFYAMAAVAMDGSGPLPPAAPVPASFFGMEVLNLKGARVSLPFGTARSWDVWPNMDWADMNRASGTYDFSSFDMFIAREQAWNADVIYTFGRTPQWASSKPSVAGAYGPGQCAPPARIQDWDDFVTATVTHANGRIRYWEIWNEAQDPLFYCGDVATMVTMAQHAYRIIKAKMPDAVVLSPGVVGGNGPSWLTTYMTAGGAAVTDVVAFHGYASLHAEDLVPVIAKYRAAMASAHVSDKPLWDTEGSWGGGGALTAPASQAGYVAKSFLLQWSSGVARAVWYAYDGTTTWGGLSSSVAAAAYAQTYKWMVGAIMTQACGASGKIWTCGLARKGYTAEAVWIPNSAATFSVPVGFVQYRDLAGVVHPLNSRMVVIGDQPILLESGDVRD
jgi:hypothetical protein